jgi:nitrite reductase/ring-hydroxylating ferredoxin subunit
MSSITSSPPAAVLAGWGLPPRVPMGAGSIVPRRLSMGGAGAGAGVGPSAPPTSSRRASSVLTVDGGTEGGTGEMVGDGHHPSPTLWFDTGVRLSHLVDSSLHPPVYEYTVTGGRRRRTSLTARPPLGLDVVVNNRALTLFRHRERAIAVDAACPHNGADMCGGDIEDFVGDGGARGGGRGGSWTWDGSGLGGTTTQASSSLCVVCPRHGFVFNVETGVSEMPKGSFTIGRFETRVVPSEGGGGDGKVAAAAPTASAAPRGPRRGSTDPSGASSVVEAGVTALLFDAVGDDGDSAVAGKGVDGGRGVVEGSPTPQHLDGEIQVAMPALDKGLFAAKDF